MIEELAVAYRRDGFVAPVTILDSADAAHHRRALESAEADLGALHYRDKIHTVLGSPHELVTHPRVLDAVEQCIGPDILVYNATYIVKEPGSGAHVAWHQDLTYWGLEDDDAQVSMWLALSPATAASGCMQMIPGSHRQGPVAHSTRPDEDNVLLLGQRIEALDTSGARFVTLEPGQASFHHGWTLHASPPNRSSDRRIGLNVQFVAPHNRLLTSDDASAMLVRGNDRFGHFGVDALALDLDGPALEAWRDADARMKANFTKGGTD